MLRTIYATPKGAPKYSNLPSFLNFPWTPPLKDKHITKNSSIKETTNQHTTPIVINVGQHHPSRQGIRRPVIQTK